MRAGEKLDVLEPEAHLLHRPLQLAESSGLVHAGVDQYDARARGDRPGVAMRHPFPRKREPQPPQAGHDSLATAELALSLHRSRTILPANVDCPSPMSTAEVA